MKKKSILLTLFTAFMLFILIPGIMAGTILTSFTLRYSKQDMSKAAIDNLKSAESVSKLIEERIQNDVMDISQNELINTEVILKRDDIVQNPGYMVNITRAAKYLSQMVNTGKRIHSIYVYINGADYVITSDNGIVKRQSFSWNQWIQDYEERRDNSRPLSWIVSRTAAGNGVTADQSPDMVTDSREPVVSYIYEISSYISRVKGSIAVNIKENELCELYNNEGNAVRAYGYLCIIDQEGNVISHPDKTLIGMNLAQAGYVSEIIRQKEPEGELVYEIDGEKQLVTYYREPVKDWIFVGIYNQARLMGKVNALELCIYLGLAVWTFGGLLIAFIIAKRIYSPWRSLVQEVIRVTRNDFTNDKNEITFISRAYRELLSKEQQLFSLVENNQIRIREKMIEDILNGYLEEVNEKDWGINFRYKHFLCAVAVIDEVEKFDARYAKEHRPSIKRLILNVAKDILNQKYVSTGIIYKEDYLVIIINLQMEEEAEQNRFLKCCFTEIRSEVEKAFQVSLTTGIGNTCADLDEIRRSYENALNAVQRRMILGIGHINFYSEIATDEIEYYYPHEFEKELLNYLHMRMKDKISNTANRLIADIKNRKGLTNDNILLIFYQLLGSTTKYLADIKIDISNVFGGNFNVYRKLSEMETIDQIESFLIEFYYKIIEYMQNTMGENASHAGMIVNYIRSNYTKDIDINSIAEGVGLSYSYIRKIFKEHFGTNIVDYLNELRTQDAKKLLCQTNCTISDIALRVGYTNEQSMKRVFKKVVGLSPSEYRKHMSFDQPVIGK